jgi:2'-5' RNA ligase
MLAKLSRDLPEGDLRYEPKWDGFRCIVFRDGDEVLLGSRNERPLTRYFPDVVAAVQAQLPERCVVDGEIVIAGSDGLDFDVLSQRIHPAASRVQMLAETTPASFIAFDLLAVGDRDLRSAPFLERRAELEAALDGAQPPVHLTPLTGDPAVARDWFARFEGAGLDGVVAKAADGPYRPGERTMWKVKHERTGDFVVAGFRWYQANPTVVGSLMLGLYEGEALQHVGVIGAFPADQRRRLVEELAPYRDPVEHPWGDWAKWQAEGAADGRRLPGGLSRWNATKDLSFELLEPSLVVEAAYEHLQGHRLRHTARFRRWRPDRDPQSCTYEQMDVAVPALLSEVFGAQGSRAVYGGALMSVGTSSGKRQSAVLVPVPRADAAVGRWRLAHDPVAVAGVPAHVTLIVPWLPPDEITDDDLVELDATLKGVRAFDFDLDHIDWFGRRVLWVAPRPAEPFIEMTKLLADRFGTPPWEDEFDEVVPHLTVAHASDGVELVPVAADVAGRLPVACRAEEVWVMIGDGSHWSLRHRFVLAN